MNLVQAASDLTFLPRLHLNVQEEDLSAEATCLRKFVTWIRNPSDDNVVAFVIQLLAFFAAIALCSTGIGAIPVIIILHEWTALDSEARINERYDVCDRVAAERLYSEKNRELETQKRLEQKRYEILRGRLEYQDELLTELQQGFGELLQENQYLQIQLLEARGVARDSRDDLDNEDFIDDDHVNSII